LDFARFFSSLSLYTIDRTPWTGDQPVARPLPTQDNTDRINSDRHQCLEWDSTPRSQSLGERIHFLPQIARPP
jgi:hypothetical protein